MEDAARVDAVEQKQQTLCTQPNAELSAIRSVIASASAANKEATKQQRTLVDPCDVVFRGIPQTVLHEPMQLAVALLTALHFEFYVPHVVGWRLWNPPARI